MKSIAVGATVFLCFSAMLLALIVGAGLSVGLVLNWLMPSIDLGAATLCGLVAVFMSAIFIKKSVKSIEMYRLSELQASDDDDELMLSEEQFESLAEQLSEAVMSQMAAKEQWGRPRPKARR